MGLFDKLFQKKPAAKRGQAAPTASDTQPPIPTEGLMTSQLPALYLQVHHPAYRDRYMHQLMEIGFRQEHAEKMFAFECDIIRRYGKPYLLHPQFTKMWFFNLRQPSFQQYPKSKEDILNEKYLTMSELCKIMDEAEWHFWNSHERNLSDEVWAEFFNWRLRGAGIKFAAAYFEMIEKETGIPSANIGALCSLQGSHLSKYKWK